MKLFTAGALACLATAAEAQLPGAQSPTGMTAAMIKLFGDINAFTARAEVQVLDNSQKEIASMPMDFALLENKIRVRLDMTQIKNSSMPPGVGDTLKQMGMAQVVSIIRPDKKLVYVLYPDHKAMLNLPLPKEDTDAAEKSEIKKTPLGKETLDGHPCVKTQVIMSDKGGQKLEATTWNATDLKDFPVQIQSKENENTSIVRFKQIQFARPEASQFELPAGYTEYKNPQELMMAVMKNAQGAEKK